jgi:hypothetical protein
MPDYIPALMHYQDSQGVFLFYGLDVAGVIQLPAKIFLVCISFLLIGWT